jgi:hypothetical protein
MFKTEIYYTHKKMINFSDSIKNIHEKIIEEFNFQQADYGHRKWDLSFGVHKSNDESYTCDFHQELINVLANVPYYESFHWHNIYEPKPKEKVIKIDGWLSSKSKTIFEKSDERFGVGIDYSKQNIKVGVHSLDNLSFIERTHLIIKDELGLERPQRLEGDDYRRKMLDPKIFFARHFDKKGNEYYSTISNFLSLLGFEVTQGEEYESTGIPDKVKHRIDQNEIIIVNASGDRPHDWLISESSYAVGKNKHVILIIESTTEIATGILGKDFEYIKYPENEIEKVFLHLLREFRSIGVKGIFY